jgi:hypothetical protein
MWEVRRWGCINRRIVVDVVVIVVIIDLIDKDIWMNNIGIYIIW